MRKIVSINKGFTLFEMMVVLSIMAIMLVFILVRYRQTQNQYALDQAAQRLVADLRHVQVLAVTGANPTGAASIGGYGIKRVDNDTYALFYNTSSDADGCPSGSDGDLSGGVVDLPEGVTIESSPADIFFAPPQPKTCIGGNSGTPSITFTLSRSGSQSKTVNVTKAGQIEVQ